MKTWKSKGTGLPMLAILTIVITAGCAMMGSKISKPQITSMPNNSFQIDLRGGVMTKRETLQVEWLKVAGQKCEDYEIISRDFALQYDMPTISGIIKCKKK